MQLKMHGASATRAEYAFLFLIVSNKYYEDTHEYTR
jgi:hypothetical protein